MAKLRISEVKVVQGHLYEVWAEDQKLVVYDSFVRVVADGNVYDHFYLFKGYVEDDLGFCHPNYSAKDQVEKLAARIEECGFIDTQYWHFAGNLSEIREREEERLMESWSDYSDHFEDYYYR